MTKHNIWSISIIGLLFGLLFTPLIVTKALYFPYVTGKVFTFRAIVTVITILWTILIIKKPEFMPKKSILLCLSASFVGWLLIANIFSIDPANSYFSNYERMEGWFTHFYLFLLLLVTSSVMQGERVWNWFFGISVAIANIVALYATFDTLSRTQIFLGNSTYVAIYVLFNIFFALLLTYRISREKFEITALKYVSMAYYILSVLLFTYVIFRTQTRGTVLALVFSSVLFLILSTISYWKNKNVRIVALVLFIISIVGIFLFWQNKDSAFIQNNPLLVRIATISATEGTGKARLVNWGIALNGIKERPVVGWGQENYTYVFAQKYDPLMYGQEPWFDRTHNAFLDWTIQGGFPALALYVLLFVYGIFVVKKSTSLTRTEKNLLISLFFAYGIHNMFVFDNYSSYLMFFILLGFVVHHDQKEKIKTIVDEKIKLAIVIFVAIVLIFISFFTIIRPLSASRDLITIFTQKDGNKVLEIYRGIFAKNTFGSHEAGIRLLGDAGSFMRVDNDEFKKAYYDLVIEVGDKMISSKPKDVRTLEAYGTFLYQLKNNSKAIEVLERAQTLAPNRHNNLYILGLAYIEAGQFEKAKEVFKHAYEVLPENQKAKTYYGGALLLSGDKTGNEMIKGFDYKDPFFITVYGQTKQYKEVIKIREQMRIDNPKDYQNLVSLAIAYVLDLQKAKGIQILRDVQKMVPEFKVQGDYLIKEILSGKKII